MKYLAALLFIISFVGIGIFGSAAMLDMGPNHSGDCIASAIDGTICLTSIMGMTLHHISAIQTLMTAVPSSSSWLWLLASLLLASVSIFLFYKNLLYPKLEFLVRRIRELVFNSLPSQQKIISWLSLFELSPALQ